MARFKNSSPETRPARHRGNILGEVVMTYAVTTLVRTDWAKAQPKLIQGLA
ncbi:hypothetical protein GCM10011614_34690 [Novosphingobium colocasiae]|uniref:Uncharacterized protein n=1 Tax=Novosphingobium colocasiae TaxID=1256513 RepID=A0A918PNH0_9SPHN|nr:hypothetical protein GCM10011614_34690 [Novosphingobium colocasiae]